MASKHFLKVILMMLVAVLLDGSPAAFAATFDPRFTTINPRTQKPVIHRAGRFGVHRIDRRLRGTEERLGTPAHGVNILNSTITNRIDTRAVAEHAFLVGIDERLQISKLVPPTFSGRQNLGDNHLLTGSLQDGRATKSTSQNNQANAPQSQAAGESAANSRATAAAGDGQGGSMGYYNDLPGELNQEKTHMIGDKVIMGQGSILVSHQNKISVQTRPAEIQLAPLSSALIVQLGDDVAVYNLGDLHQGDVTVVLNNQEKLAVPLGHQMVLSFSHSQYTKANPTERIECHNVKHLGQHHGAHVFDAIYSPISTLDNTPQFEELLASPRSEDRQAAERMLKSVAALLAVSGQ